MFNLDLAWPRLINEDVCFVSFCLFVNLLNVITCISANVALGITQIGVTYFM